MASPQQQKQLPKENPEAKKFHSARDAGSKLDAAAFASEAATVGWLEKSARDPKFLEQLRKFAEHHPTLAAASKLTVRLFMGSIARALREGSIWYELDAKTAGGGGGGGGGAASGTGAGGGTAAGTATKAAAAGAGGTSSKKVAGSGTLPTMSFDPPPNEPEPDPLETPPAVPGRAAEGMTH